MFTRLFALPACALAQRMLHSDGSRTRAMSDTAAAEPAFVRIQHDGRFAFLRIGHQHIRAAYLDALQAAGTEIGVKQNCLAC